MHLLRLLFTSLHFSDPSGSNLFFRSSLILSHRTRVSAVIKVFSSSDNVCQDLTGCFSHCCVEGDHWIYLCIFVIHDGERWKLPACYSLKDSTILGSFSFSRSNLCLVCFGLLILFQAKADGHHQQVVITSNVCSWKISCSGNVHSWSEALPL